MQVAGNSMNLDAQHLLKMLINLLEHIERQAVVEIADMLAGVDLGAASEREGILEHRAEAGNPIHIIAGFDAGRDKSARASDNSRRGEAGQDDRRCRRGPAAIHDHPNRLTK